MGWRHVLVLPSCLRDPFPWDEEMPTGTYLATTTLASRLSSRRPSKLSLWETSSTPWLQAMGKLEERVSRSISWIQCVSSSDLLRDRMLLQQFAGGAAAGLLQRQFTFGSARSCVTPALPCEHYYFSPCFSLHLIRVRSKSTNCGR